MYGVVSLLDNKHYQLVKDLCTELAREFAASGVYIPSYPHISYQVTRRYTVKSLEPVLQRFAASKTSFQVQAGGLDIFTGPYPVLYIPVVRSPELTQFHAEIWQEISSMASGIEDYYRPAHWVPHITICIGNMKKDNLSPIVRLLAEYNFNWQMTVDNITLMYDSIFTLFRTRISMFAMSAPGELLSLKP